jgi:uncharacterized Zn finger protein (UPF0148 family)
MNKLTVKQCKNRAENANNNAVALLETGDLYGANEQAAIAWYWLRVARMLKNGGDTCRVDCPNCGAVMAVEHGELMYCPVCNYSWNEQLSQHE